MDIFPTLAELTATARYRLVEWKPFDSDEAPEYELYDYEDDPLETTNLAELEWDVLAQLKAILATHPEAKRPRE